MWGLILLGKIVRTNISQSWLDSHSLLAAVSSRFDNPWRATWYVECEEELPWCTLMVVIVREENLLSGSESYEDILLYKAWPYVTYSLYSNLHRLCLCYLKSATHCTDFVCMYLAVCVAPIWSLKNVLNSVNYFRVLANIVILVHSIGLVLMIWYLAR